MSQVQTAPDGTHTVEITVGWSDIILGGRNDVYECPIARAVYRRDGFDDSFVDDGILEFRYGERCYQVKMPDLVEEFVQRFDKRRMVKPFKFKLEFGEDHLC